MKRLALLTMLLGMVAFTVGCPAEPETTPGVDLGGGQTTPDVPTATEVAGEEPAEAEKGSGSSEEAAEAEEGSGDKEAAAEAPEPTTQTPVTPPPVITPPPAEQAPKPETPDADTPDAKTPETK